LRILLLTQWWYPEPESSRGLPFARWLCRRGHEVIVLTGFPNYPAGRLYPGYEIHWKQWDETNGIKVLRVPLYPNHDRSATKRVVNYMSFALCASAIGMPEVGDVDVVYAMATPPTVGLPSLLNRVIRGVPYVFNITDMWPEAVIDSGMIRNGIKRRAVNGAIDYLCRLVYGSAAELTAISKGYRRMAIEQGFPAERVHAVYNWVDEELFRPVPRNEVLARTLGLAGKFNFLYGGNFGPLQGIETIIRAAVRLQSIPDIQIALVGTGQVDGELRALAADLGASNVHFTGRVDQSIMPEVYALADVLVMHLNESEYLRATVPGKTQVYLACGKPIIIAADCEATEIIRDAGAGLTTPPRDPDALAEAMLQMYGKSQAEREEFGARARHYYQNHMALEHGAPEIESVLMRAAARR